jgi:PAS domain S-box-containing protein
LGILHQLLSKDFMPHGFCYLWDPAILWLHVISDSLIALSYFCIPIVLIYFVRKRSDLPFHWMFLLFGTFILSCGATHVMEVWTVWHPSYLASGLIKAFTAGVSLVTAALLIPLVPQAMALPSPSHLQAVNRQLEIQISDRKLAEERARKLKEELEQRVARRTSELAKANDALRAGEGRLANVIESAMDAIITVDEQQRIVLFNRTAEKMFGWAAKEALGQPLERLIPDRFRGAHRGHIHRFGETGTTSRGMGTTGTLWGLRADGTEFPIEASISQFESSGKKVFTVILRDITERKHSADALAAKEEMLRLLLDGIQDYAIYMLDTEGKVASWNSGAARIKGYTAEEILGKHFSTFYLPADRASGLPDAVLKEAFASGKSEREGMRVRKDGTTFWAHTVILPLFDASGKLRGFSKVLQDVTERKNTEITLREQAEALDLTAVFVRDLRGSIVLWSGGCEKLYGYTQDEALGRNFRELLKTEFLTPLPKMEATLRETGRCEGELVNYKRDGSKVVSASVWILQRDAAGQPARVLQASADITARKHAEDALVEQAAKLSRQADELRRTEQALREQTVLLQSVLESIGDGFVAADPQGRFVLWNRAGEELLGRGEADIPIKEWSAHYHVYLPDGVTPYPTDQLPLVRAIRGEASDVEMQVENPKSGTRVWLEVTGRPLRDESGVSRGGVVAFHDITQKKEADRRVHKLNDELERRVKERTSELEASNKELEAFTYSVSHDLRAPLRHISGFSDILMEDFAPKLDAEVQQYLTRIRDATGRMGQLVDELLNLARVGRQAVEVQITGLASIVEEVITLLKPEYEGREVEWKISQLPFVECDSTLIKQVFQNLISNALKYSRPRTPAIIEIGHTEQEGAPVIFVRDNGVGFSMKYADKLFGVFQRLHRSEDFEGTGIGLATVQRIIKKHRGRVWAEAELDKGATFYFTLEALEQTQSLDRAVAAGA